jgi:hypothetical protein
VLFHVSPAAARESILCQGLVPADPCSSWEVEEAPAGVYLWKGLGNARDWARWRWERGHDIWEVRVSDDEVWPDPEAALEDGQGSETSFFSQLAIPPGDLALVVAAS